MDRDREKADGVRCLDSLSVPFSQVGKILSALVTGVAAMALLAGCTGGASNLIPRDTASSLSSEFDRIDSLVSGGDCFAALDATEAARDQVLALTDPVDSNLRRSLLEGVRRLQIVIQDECRESDETDLVTDAVTETPDTTDADSTTETDQDPGGTRPAAPKPKPEPEPAPTPEPTPTPTPTPPNSGGVSPSTGGGGQGG